jgi:PAS domain S-box-containing protein
MALTTLAAVMLASVVGMGVAFLVWLHRDRPGAGPLATFVVAASLWTVAYGLELAVQDPGTMQWLLQVQLTLSVVVPIAWLVAVLEYTGHPHWLSRRRVALLLVEPAVFVTLVWSNPGHGLVWRVAETVSRGELSALAPTWGLVRWAHLAYLLVLVLAGGVLLLRLMLQTNQLFRSQGAALIVVITVPMAAHSLHLLSVAPPLLDPTSLGYVVSGVVLSAAILQGQLLDVAPVTRNLGREAILEEMDDRVVIVDEAGRIVDVNDAAADLFDVSPVALLGRLLGNELPELAATIPGPGERAHTETHLERNGAVRYYDVRVTPLYRAYGAVSGHLVSLRDVTERRQREQRITVLNRLLRHDIRNEMNVVRGNADLLADHTNGGGRERIDRILTTVDTVVERSNKIGAVSEALDAEDARPLDLTALVDPVVAEARERYSDAEVVVERPDTVGVLASPSLTLAFEELVDNAVEHADGPVTVTIIVERGAEGVTVRVSDDGPGIADHEREVIRSGDETPLQHGSGVGLWLVKWVVRNAGGTMSFVDGPGTTVEIELPRADPPAATSG